MWKFGFGADLTDEIGHRSADRVRSTHEVDALSRPSVLTQRDKVPVADALQVQEDHFLLTRVGDEVWSSSANRPPAFAGA